MPLKMKQLPEIERPYEKLKMYGEKKLSNSELLAIIIKTGTKDENSLEIANKILLLVSELNELQNIEVETLKKIKGIGEIKAIQIKAVCELARRMNLPINNINKKVKSTRDVAEMFIDELRYEKYEIIKILLLNVKNEIIRIIDFKKGIGDEASIEYKKVMYELTKLNAKKFIIIHNHPNGIDNPTIEDFKFTKKIKECSDMLGIKFVDHIIIAKGNYVSLFREENEK